MFNKFLIQQYAETYNYTIEEVEREINKMKDILISHKYYDEETAIAFIERGMEAVVNIK